MKISLIGSMLLAALPASTNAMVPSIRNVDAVHRHTNHTQVWPTLPISASIWKTWASTCASCIAKELPAGVLTDPKNLVEDTKSVIDEYCKLPPNFKKPLEELAFYGDMLTTRYQSPLRFFNFEVLTEPIHSAESVHRHDSLKRKNINRDSPVDWPELQACYTSAECNAARGFWDTCFHHFSQQDSPYDAEHTWNCFCRQQGPETGPAGGIDGPWGRNATACNQCINNVIAPSKLDSYTIISEYCYIQIGRFEAAAEGMVWRATQQTIEQGSPIQLLNYTLVL
ncbi:hypothetical protein HYALB_00004208 [Hymenoscyphus albidus]|uniref:Uncharacterized protein n=1 Tax=Hymenoscyphus albidus TaxID=595503 RepID=A0A9N9Q8T1_9HELO|nr:hypothetical protein HYALB_00004208 [Hymenoscyphus albidus]